jgi:uncharacterized NAD-dependent epimerase/dehydratase family protein
MSRDQRFLILADGLFGPDSSKTANACIRYTPQRVVGVIDATRAGQTAGDVIGFGGDIPVVATLDEGLALKPNALLIGIAPAGGKLPPNGSASSRAPSRTGLEIWSGLPHLHRRRAGAGRAGQIPRVAIHDLRRPPASLDVSRGRVRAIDATIVLTVGTDCNIGKMTTQLQILDALVPEGSAPRSPRTGQTGILIEGRGMAVDAVVAGLHRRCRPSVSCSRTRRMPIWCSSKGRGRSSTRATPGVTYGLMHGSLPHAQVMCAQPTRRAINGCEWVKIPPLPEFIRLSEQALAPLRRRP